MKYYISFILSLSLIISSFAQSNCSNALALTPGIQQCGDSNGFSGDFPSDGSSPVNPCSVNHNDDEYWFTYTPGAEVDEVELTLSSISTFFSGIYVFDNCPTNSPSCIVGDQNLVSTADITVAFSVSSGTVYKIVVTTFGPPDGTTFCLDAAETLCLAPFASISASPIDISNCPTTVDYTISIDDLMDSNSLTISTDDGTGSPAGVGGVVSSEGDFIITNIPVPQSNWTIKIAHENNSSCDIELGPFELACPASNNDLCDAIEIIVDANLIQGTNAFADSETSEPDGTCWAGSGNLNSVWYSFFAPSSATARITTDYGNTPLHDTHIAVYTASDCSDLTSLVQIACNEDGGVAPPFGNAAVVVAENLIVGDTYYIQVDGKQDEVGEFNIRVIEVAPTGDDCSTAIVLNNGNQVAILSGQYFDGASPSGYGTASCDVNSTPVPNDLWYKYGSASGETSVQVDPGPNSDIVLSIYTGCFPQLLEYCVDGNGIGGIENVSVPVSGSNTTYVRVYEKTFSGEEFVISATISPLPLTLGNFEGKDEKRGNLIYWTSLMEVNTGYIEIQSSPQESFDWTVIGRIEAKGESNKEVNYEFFDFNPYELTYYRLNVVDKDGKEELSRIINVKRSDVLGQLTLSPNPARSNITVQTASQSEELSTISIIDMTGKVVMRRSQNLIKGLNSINVELDELSPGLYLFSLQTENDIQVEKFVKQ